MNDDTEDLKMKLALAESERRMREASDDRYARKIVERIVFAVIAIFALAALYFIFAKVGLSEPQTPNLPTISP